MDIIEANKNKKKLCDEIERLQSLSRGLMTQDEMIVIDRKIRRHKDQVKNINQLLRR